MKLIVAFLICYLFGSFVTVFNDLSTFSKLLFISIVSKSVSYHSFIYVFCGSFSNVSFSPWFWSFIVSLNVCLFLTDCQKLNMKFVGDILRLWMIVVES